MKKAHSGGSRPDDEAVSQSTYLGPLRQKARAILDAMPPHPELYWHGKNGRPCPCGSCSSAGPRLLWPVEPKGKR